MIQFWWKCVQWAKWYRSRELKRADSTSEQKRDRERKGTFQECCISILLNLFSIKDPIFLFSLFSIVIIIIYTSSCVKLRHKDHPSLGWKNSTYEIVQTRSFFSLPYTHKTPNVFICGYFCNIWSKESLSLLFKWKLRDRERNASETIRPN